MPSDCGYPSAMEITARLRQGESLADRILRVDHVGEHGAVCIYTMQYRVARLTAASMRSEIAEFIRHEARHRALFGQEVARRGHARCFTYWPCGALGSVLGLLTGLLGARAIAATTVAIERVVLRHMHAQLTLLERADPTVAAILRDIIVDEQHHHDSSMLRCRGGWLETGVDHVVATATEAMIRIGMNRR